MYLTNMYQDTDNENMINPETLGKSAACLSVGVIRNELDKSAYQSIALYLTFYSEVVMYHDSTL